MEIFIHREDQDFGPYTLEEAQQHLDSGELLREDYAWFEGAADWMALEEIPGIVAPEVEPVAEQEAPPPHANTGLPAWIPPRRTDDPQSTSTTSFAAPAPRPLGIRTVSTKVDKDVQAVPRTTLTSPTSSPKSVAPQISPQAREPARAAPIVRPMTSIIDDDEAGDLPDPATARSPRSLGTRNIIFGALWFVGGVVVTFLAYRGTIAQGHDGVYLLSGAAIIAGLVQFLRGMVQVRKPS